jgi:hypothetical protein
MRGRGEDMENATGDEDINAVAQSDHENVALTRLPAR